VEHQPKGDHPADAERRIKILDALVGEIRRSSMPVTLAYCERWDRRLGLKTAEDIFVNLERHAPDFAPANYAARLQRAAMLWMKPAFQRGVVRALSSMGFPDVVATALASRMLYVCLDWAGCHWPPNRPWPEGTEWPPPPPFSVAPRAVRGGRRGPRRQLSEISPSRRGKRKTSPPYDDWAHWYFRVDICGEPQTAVAKSLFGPKGMHEHTTENTTENCGCKRAVSRPLKQTRGLLGVAGVARPRAAREPLHPFIGVPIRVRVT
jgi:hypothetical protein